MALCCVKIQRPSNLCLSLSDLCTSSLRLMKPTRQTCSKAYCDQNLGTWPPTAVARTTTHGQWLLELSHVLPKILDYQLESQPHMPPRRPSRSPIHLAWESSNHTMSHVPTRAAWVFVSSPCAGTRPSRIEEHILMSSGDVIIPCQHATHALGHVSD